MKFFILVIITLWKVNTLYAKLIQNDYICEMKPQEVILIGAGGHALSLAEFAGEMISGYLANEGKAELPGIWYGPDSAAPALVESGNFFHMAYVYSGLPVMKKRRHLIEEYEKLGARFATLVSPTAIVTPLSRLGEGCAVMNGAIINRATLGRNVIVNSGAIIEHDCVIGENSFIGPGAVVGGFTSIGENCFIGLGARIGNGLTIGDNITVAMGAVVNKNLTEPGIYHGAGLKRFKLKE